MSPRSLAMAEMTALTAAIYRTFETSIAPGFEMATPGITARFELFYDVRFAKVMVWEHLLAPAPESMLSE